MNKILLLALGLFIFGCDNANRTTENSGVENTTSDNNATESVQEGAGSEISPQLEGIEDSATRLKVDTISSSLNTKETK